MNEPIKWRADQLKPTAWDLECRLLQVIEQLAELPEGTDIPEALGNEVIDAMQGAQEKRDALAGAYLRRRKHIELLYERAQDAANKAHACESALVRFNNYLLSILDLAGTKRIEGVQYKIGWQQNPPKVEVDAEEFLKMENLDRTVLYMREVPRRTEPDKVAIKAALEAGEVVPGAKLVEGTRRIVIK